MNVKTITVDAAKNAKTDLDRTNVCAQMDSNCKPMEKHVKVIRKNDVPKCVCLPFLFHH